MKVLILTEAGQKVGFGHLSRCSAIYHAFVARGIRPLLIVNGDCGVAEYLKGIHHEITDWLTDFQELLSRIAGADIVFIDSYLTDESKYRDIASTVGLIACVDDYKRIRYPQGIVINGLIYAPIMKYPRTKGIDYLLGPRYAFFAQSLLERPGKDDIFDDKEYFLTFGGSDFLELAPDTLQAVCARYPHASKTIVISQFYKQKERIREAADERTTVVVDATDEQMKGLMIRADVAVSAAGQTLSELATLGVPGVAVCVVDNQRHNFKAWTERGFMAARPTPSSIILGLQRLESQTVRRRISRRLRKSMTGKGAFAIVDALLKKASAEGNRRKRVKRLTVRPINGADCRDIWLWRNTQHARTASFQSAAIPYVQHVRWFDGKMNDRRSTLWIVEADKRKVGYVRHDAEGNVAVNSVLLNPQFYGYGLGAEVIRKADQAFLKKRRSFTICAEIQDHHTASIRAFEKAGYRLSHRIVKNGKKAGVYQWQA